MVVVTAEGRRLIILFEHFEKRIIILCKRDEACGIRRLTDCHVLKSTYNDNRTGELLGRGSAICHPNDKFSKSTGRKISLARALKAAELSLGERQQVWIVYLREHKIRS